LDSNLYYFRDSTGNEVDLILDYSDKVIPVEIKSGSTFSEDMLKGLQNYTKISKGHFKRPAALIYGGGKSMKYKEFDIFSLHDLHRLDVA
jgi:predicted AAA+ superfamily ATPase